MWPLRFTADFNETSKMYEWGKNNGTLYYDAQNNRETVERDNGRYDRFCGQVIKNEDTPCTHFILNSKSWIYSDKRFLDFPKKKYCCFCCDGEHGCGITSRDWMVKSGGVYNGTEQLDSKGPYQKWFIPGLQDNFYWNKDDSFKTPRKLDQMPNDLMDFYTYTEGKIDESKFTLPSYCTSKCPDDSFCGRFRTTKNL